MEKNSTDKHFIWSVVLIISIISFLFFWTMYFDMIDMIDNYDVVNSSIPGYTEEEIEKEILLGNEKEIETKRVYKFKNIKISKENYYINKNEKLLGEFLEIDIRKGYTKHEFFIYVKEEKTIDMLLNLKTNEFLELSYVSKKTNHYGNMNIFYEVVGKGKIVSDNVYNIFYVVILPLMILFLFGLIIVSTVRIGEIIDLG